MEEDRSLGKSALVVDDSSIVRHLAIACLHRLGFSRVDTAANGLEAVEKLSAHRPDIVFTDYDMPKMNGVQLVSWIRNEARLQDLRVVAVTSMDLSAGKWEPMGFSDYISKPFTPEEVRATLDRLG